MSHVVGRPRCDKRCCQKGGSSLTRSMYEGGLTQRAIGREFGVSCDHIGQILRARRVKMRKREDYPPSAGGGRARKSPLWEISDRDLFDKPLKELTQLYGVSPNHVAYVRERRKT